MSTVFENETQEGNGFDEVFFDAEETPDLNAESAHQGGTVSKEGWYHFHVAGIKPIAAEPATKETDGKLPQLRVDLQVLAGTEESEKNRYVYHYLYFQGWEDSKDHTKGTKPLNKDQHEGIKTFAHAFGLISDADLEKKIRIPLHLLEGRQAIGRVQKDVYQGRTSFKVKFNNDFYPIGHGKVRDVPKDPEALALLGLTLPDSNGSGNGASGAENGGGETDISDV